MTEVKKVSILETVTKPVKRAPRITLYGTAGIGKSTFASLAPKPLFLDIEDGLDNLDVPRLRCRSFPDVMEALRALYTDEHEYKTIVLDSADWLEALIFKDVCREHKVSNIEEVAKGFGKGYTFALGHWNQLLTALTSLRNHKNMAIILLAHNQVKRYDDPMTDSYDRHKLKLNDKASALVTEWSDCLLFANYKTYIDKSDGGFNKEIKKGKGHGERVMYTSEKPSFFAKNRYGLPDELAFNWKELTNNINKTNNKKG